MRRNNSSGGNANNEGKGGGNHGNARAHSGAPYQQDYRYSENHRLSRKPNSSRQAASHHLSVVYFHAQNDAAQPWFHKSISREEAVAALKSETAGTFLIRPSSQRGNYALSWLDAEGRVRHNLICNKFPGYSLEDSQEVYPNLIALVERCKSFLSKGLPRRDYNQGQEALPTTAKDMVKRLNTALKDSSECLDSLTWKLVVVESLDTLANAGRRSGVERRTHINYCLEQYTAPQLFRLNGPIAVNVFDAMASNNTLRYLAINGHSGMTRINFQPNIGDTEVSLLVQALLHNTSLTHLDLSANAIGDEGAQRLAELIRVHKTLRKLVLLNNFIQRRGLQAIGDALTENIVLDDVQIGQQYKRAGFNGREVVICADPFHRALVALIEDTFKRKRELLMPSQHAPYFHGFLSREDAEKRLADKPVGSFLFYLDENTPGVILLAFVHSNLHAEDPTKPTIVFHKAIYRSYYGYTLGRPTEDYSRAACAATPVISLRSSRDDVGRENQRGCRYNPTHALSLVDIVCWKIVSRFPLLEKANELLRAVPTVLDRVRQMQTLPMLWKVYRVPSLNASASFASHSYPTLHQFIMRNRSFLTKPVHAQQYAASGQHSHTRVVHPRPVVSPPHNVHSIISPAATPPPLDNDPPCNLSMSK